MEEKILNSLPFFFLKLNYYNWLVAKELKKKKNNELHWIC